MSSKLIVYVQKWTWRDEKSGKGIALVDTRDPLPLPEMYRNKRILGVNEWKTISCKMMDVSTPYFPIDTPLEVSGTFENVSSNPDYSWTFAVSHVKLASAEPTRAMNFLRNFCTKHASEHLLRTIGVQDGECDIFGWFANEDSIAILRRTLKDENAMSLRDRINSLNVALSLLQKFAPCGLSFGFVAKLIKEYGAKAQSKLVANPYEIGIKQGIPFKVIDAIAYQCGISAYSSERLTGVSNSVMHSINENGHCWVDFGDFCRTFFATARKENYHKKISLTEALPSILQGDVKADNISASNRIILYSKTLREAEGRITSNLKRLAVKREDKQYSPDLVAYSEEKCDMHYGAEQKKAFYTILHKAGVKCFVGGPGTGKTSTVKGIIEAYHKMHPDAIIKLCAPTGRAAQRLAESTGMPATTLHRLLEYRPYGDSDIHKNKENQLDADFLVVDEMSMTDILLFDVFMESVKTGATVVLVGDTNQLESVGSGAVLRDILTASDKLVEKVRLTEVFRQKGGSPIIDNSIRICNGDFHLEETPDFQIIHTQNNAQSLEIAKDLEQELFNKDNLFETQILCPSKKGDAGVNNINYELQAILNPSSMKELHYGRTTFRIHDKILMTRNNYDKDYYNGDIGTIVDIEDDNLLVNIRGEEKTLGKDCLEDIKLSYGMTIHKSQGSEFQNVIVVMPQNPSNMLVRNLFYTAITRAKKRVFIIDENDAVKKAIVTDKSRDRRTFLANDIFELEQKGARA